jgi:hypothetical protein
MSEFGNQDLESGSQESGWQGPVAEPLTYRPQLLVMLTNEASERLARTTDKRMAKLAQILRCALDDKAPGAEIKAKAFGRGLLTS